MRALYFAAVALLACPANAKQPSLSELSGDVTVVAFWASWCPPCRKELPMVEALRRRLLGDAGVRVVAVSVDAPRDAARARRLAHDLGLTAPLLVDQPLYVALFGGGDLSVPRLLVIDRKRAGLQRQGALADEQAEGFVRQVVAAIESVRAGAPKPPSPMWQPFFAKPR